MSVRRALIETAPMLVYRAMCGIAGLLSTDRPIGEKESREVIRRMTDALRHRGPDDSGLWIDWQTGIALGHRRLSVIDLSSNGHQPMQSSSGRYCIVYNGEIYNFLDLRAQLEQRGYQFRGHSDTEIMLAAIEEWGLEAAVEKFVGMFAFACFDAETKVLHLVRDRIGEKPLYYGWVGKSFIFASELKSLREHPDWCGEIDRGALTLMMRYGYIPAPYSIHKGIYKLPPGTILSLDGTARSRSMHAPFANSGGENSICPRSYWSLRKVAEQGIRDSIGVSETDALEELNAVLTDAVKRQMISDVSLGAFLSGGIDSTTVVAIMQAQSRARVKSFTIGFHEADFDEAHHARKVAAYLGTEHTQLYVSADQAMNVIPNLASIYDEPFADSSQLPTFLVSQLARQHVTVSLSGDGGDELFAGYNRYLWTEQVWKHVRRLPLWARNSLAGGITSISPEGWTRTSKRLRMFAPFQSIFQQPVFGQKLHKVANVMRSRNVMSAYRDLVSYWSNPIDVVVGGHEPEGIALSGENRLRNQTELTDQLMYWDVMFYLPDNNLVKLDRAAMATSLETRLPLLDHRVVEYAWRVPLHLKVNHGKGKWLLRQLLYRYVPKELVERPKMGFSVPVGQWLRGPLRAWAEDLLAEHRLTDDGYLNPRIVRARWSEHLSGRRDWQAGLWTALMFQAWRDSVRR
jgi:asparagine synthase (glutamine-hydrolysing)